jgi:hypothetical protein
MGNRNSKDTRPTRKLQKARSVGNKIKQLNRHIDKNPTDKNAQNKLKKALAGHARKRTGVHPTEPVLVRYADGKVKRDKKQYNKK